MKWFNVKHIFIYMKRRCLSRVSSNIVQEFLEFVILMMPPVFFQPHNNVSAFVHSGEMINGTVLQSNAAYWLNEELIWGIKRAQPPATAWKRIKERNRSPSGRYRFACDDCTWNAADQEDGTERNSIPFIILFIAGSTQHP